MALPVKQEGLFVFATTVIPRHPGVSVSLPAISSIWVNFLPVNIFTVRLPLLYIQVIWINHYFNLPEI